jgi:hypothetical protein
VSAAVVCFLGGGAAAPGAFAIGDRSYFDGRSATVLDFELDGQGNDVGLQLAGEARLMSPDAYLAAGVTFDSPAVWYRMPLPVIGTPFDGPPGPGELGDAHAAAGSGGNSLIGGGAIRFTTPVSSVGISIIQIGLESFTSAFEGSVGLAILDGAGNRIDTVILYGDLIDGGFDGQIVSGDGLVLDRIRYGFIGLHSETPIHGVEFIHGQSAYFDDLHFVPIPAPSVGVAFGVFGLGALARRRR